MNKQAKIFFIYHFYLSSSLSFIKRMPNMFLPDPFPPSAQYLSFDVCSISSAGSVSRSCSLSSSFYVNFHLRTCIITSSLTSSQSFLKVAELPRPSLAARPAFLHNRISSTSSAFLWCFIA